MSIMGKKEYPKYTAVIRTLGTAGEKYQTLLDSLIHQSIKPEKIVVYLAEGFARPKETVATEEIVYVKKGMVAQRALPYNEVETDWILFLDDDIKIDRDGVEILFEALISNNADVIAFDPFPHHRMSVKQKLIMTLLGTSIPRIGRRSRGYTVNCFGSDVYNNNPKEVGWSTTNAGAAFICRKRDFLNIHLEEDLWLDESPYAIPEDKVMFYKMHLSGLKILTHFIAPFTHLDASSTVSEVNQTARGAKIAYSSARNNKIFYELYVKPNLSKKQRATRALVRPILRLSRKIYSYLKTSFGISYKEEYRRGIEAANEYLSSRKINHV